MIFLPLMVLWARRPYHFSNRARYAALTLFLVGITLGGPTSGGNPENREESSGRQSSELSDANQRHREGSRVTDLVGSLRETGRRWTFTTTDGAVAYRLLENQPLERIARSIAEDPQDRNWKISGVLTEFFDENLLLIDRIERATELAD